MTICEENHSSSTRASFEHSSGTRVPDGRNSKRATLPGAVLVMALITSACTVPGPCNDTASNDPVCITASGGDSTSSGGSIATATAHDTTPGEAGTDSAVSVTESSSDTANETVGETLSGSDSANETTVGDGNLWCDDSDNDGFGDPESCASVAPGDDPPDGTVNNNNDCNDQDENTYPGAAENEPELCAADNDDDGYGDQTPVDGVDPGSDCNDSHPIINLDCLCKPVDDLEINCTSPSWGFAIVDNLSGPTEPEWGWSQNSQEICEPNNGPSTGIVCDGWDMASGTRNFIVEVKSEIDNDWIGVFFGWQDWSHYYFLSWKKTAQLADLGNLDCLPIGTFAGGITVKSVDALVVGDVGCRDMHEDADTLHSELIWSPGDSPDTNQGWAYNVPYLFAIDMSLDTGFIITITNLNTKETVAVIDSDDTTYPDGKVGFLSASQEASCLSGFSSTYCE